MHTLDRYILRQLLIVLVLVLVSLTLLAWFTQIITLLDIIVEKRRSLGEFFGITLLLLPLLMGMISPFAIFAASVFVLDRLNRDSELAVISASGLSRWRLLRPFALAGVMTIALVAVINLYVQPLSMHAYRGKLSGITADLVTVLIEEGRFISPQTGVMVHVRQAAPGGVLNGILLEDTRNADRPVTYIARRAVLLEGEQAPHLLLQDGTVLTGDSRDFKTTLVHFEQYSLSLVSLLEDPRVADLRPSDQFFGDLIAAAAEAGDTPGGHKLRAELHNRLSTPLYILVMILIAFVALSEPRTTRRARIVTLIAVTAVAAATRIGGFYATNLVAGGSGPIQMMYAIPAAAGIIAVAVIVYQSGRGGRRPRARPRHDAGLRGAVAR